MSLRPPATSPSSPSIPSSAISSQPTASLADQQVSSSPASTSLSSQYPVSASPSTKSTGPPIGIIVGVVAGVLVIIIGTVVWFILRRRRQRRLANQDHSDDKDTFGRRSRVWMSLKSFAKSKPSDQNLRHGRHDGDGGGEEFSFSSSGRGRDLEQQHHTNTGNNHMQQKGQQPDGSPSTIHPYDLSSCHDNTSTSTSPRHLRDQTESLSSRDHHHHHHYHNHSDNEDASSCTITMSTTSSPSPPVSMVSSSTPVPPPPPPKEPTTNNNTFLKPEVKNDVHIDMVSMDLEVLLPVIISDEILITSSPEPTASQIGTPKSSSTEVDETSSVDMPVPVPRRRPPSLATHRGADSFIQGGRARISMCHPPPPPPPTNPPPEIPKDALCPNTLASARRSRTSTYIAGRRSMSVDHQGKGSGGRNSVHWKEGQDGGDYLRRDSTSSLSSSTTVAPLSPRIRANSSPTIDFSALPVNRCPRTNKIILPPSSPPPPLPSSPPLNSRGRARLSHQRSPSQVMNNSFWTSPQLSSSSTMSSPTLSSSGSPISPPLSPLTVQIPRPISKAYLNSSGIMTAGSRPESPIISGSNIILTARSSPSSSLSHLPIPTRVVRQQQQQVHMLMQQERRTRSHSLDDHEKVASTESHHRIVISPSSSASSSNCPSPQYPPVPSPPVPQSYLLLRRPSLVLQEQQAMSGSGGIYGHPGDPLRLSRAMTGASTGLSASQPYVATRSSSIAVPESGRKSVEAFKTSDHQKQRRSMSLDSAAAAIATCAAASSSSECPSSSTAAQAMREQAEHGRETDGGHDETASDGRSATSSSVDQELQSIIADAIAIAAAKSAAIEAARHSTWYRQHQSRYQQMYQQQSLEAGLASTTSQHRPWTPTPSEDYFPPWGSPSGAPSNSTSSSRSASPFHSSGSPS
ncbi:hypothetical protein EMPS_08000 [Entomortierella parvispora]|uniref:Uncharacterized protein n=1 Tax=Entomortierella parvispora TaxID=205924 RepID=A0A9P3HFF3_9FUNG|nr:hypothetical protein EMPS_08000 [Entomortierella parvispora]